jgi:hypothetical protein
MARTGLTNFVVWALACLFLGYLLAPTRELVLLAGASLVVAAFTRFWPEGLGVASGAVALLLLGRSVPAALLLGIATVATWRFRLGGIPRAALPNGTSAPWRLGVAALVAAVAVFMVDGFLLLAFGFTCQSDTTQATPGSDRAAWCDALGKHDVAIPVLFGPPALVLLAGIYAATRGRARDVMIVAIAGFAVTIALHIPDFVLSNAAP